MSDIDRREFIKRSLGAIGVASMGSLVPVSSAKPAKRIGQKQKFADDRILLGLDKVEVSRLAIGTGTSGFGGHSAQTRGLGISGLADLLVAGYERGITFWDSADQYGSHPHLKEALEYVPREKVQILTKTHATNKREMRADLDRFRKELGTDYIDILLLHMMTSGSWPDKMRGAMDVISEAKEQGIVRTHGVSCHTLPALKTASETDWVNVDLARINPAGVRMDSDVETVSSVLEQMKQNGKGVIGMKILGDGRLTNNIDRCLKFALNHESVDCFTIGTESKDELFDLIDRIPKVSGA